MALLLDVLPHHGQRGAAAGGGEVRRGPEAPVHDGAVHACGEVARRMREDTPLRLFTRAETATFDR